MPSDDAPQLPDPRHRSLMLRQALVELARSNHFERQKLQPDIRRPTQTLRDSDEVVEIYVPDTEIGKHVAESGWWTWEGKKRDAIDQASIGWGIGWKPKEYHQQGNDVRDVTNSVLLYESWWYDGHGELGRGLGRGWTG